MSHHHLSKNAIHVFIELRELVRPPKMSPREVPPQRPSFHRQCVGIAARGCDLYFCRRYRPIYIKYPRVCPIPTQWPRTSRTECNYSRIHVGTGTTPRSVARPPEFRERWSLAKERDDAGGKRTWPGTCTSAITDHPGRGERWDVAGYVI